MAAALSSTTTGAGNFYCPITTDIDRGLCSLAERLGEKGAARIKDCLRDVPVNTWP